MSISSTFDRRNRNVVREQNVIEGSRPIGNITHSSSAHVGFDLTYPGTIGMNLGAGWSRGDLDERATTQNTRHRGLGKTTYKAKPL